MTDLLSTEMPEPCPECGLRMCAPECKRQERDDIEAAVAFVLHGPGETIDRGTT